MIGIDSGVFPKSISRAMVAAERPCSIPLIITPPKQKGRFWLHIVITGLSVSHRIKEKDSGTESTLPSGVPVPTQV